MGYSLNDIQRINEEHFFGTYYCVVSLKNGKQYFKTSTMSMKNNDSLILDIIEQLESLSNEIEQLTYEEITDWIEENIVEISNNYNELAITVGGPSIRLYIDSGVIKGQKGFSSNPIFIECNTSKLEEYFYDFKEL